MRVGDVAFARRTVAAPPDFARHRQDTVSKVREEVQDIARAREAAGGVARMQTIAVKGAGKKVRGICEGAFMQH